MGSKEKLLESSIKLFTKHGYLGTPTKAIAEEAGVSEMTLFRIFQTKQALFEAMLKHTLGHQLGGQYPSYDVVDCDKFLHDLLHNRLVVVSSHIDIVRMVLQESLQGRLSNELDFIKQMSTEVSNMVERMYDSCQKEGATKVASLLIGILLEYVILHSDMNYHTLTTSEQEQYLRRILAHIK